MARFNIRNIGSAFMAAALALALSGCLGSPDGAPSAADASAPPAAASSAAPTALDSATPSDAGPKGDAAQPSRAAADDPPAAAASPANEAPDDPAAPLDGGPFVGSAPDTDAAATAAPAASVSPPRSGLGAAAPRAAAPQAAVSISIVGDSDKGTILAPVNTALKDGDTVIDVLRRVTKDARIQMETRGSGQTAYVEGIANLYEFDKGGKSGWLYRVNGEFPNVSAGAYRLNKGDRIDWLYTVDMGKDVGKTDGAGEAGKAADSAK